jgi:hypothetical protein
MPHGALNFGRKFSRERDARRRQKAHHYQRFYLLFHLRFPFSIGLTSAKVKSIGITV